LPVRPVCRSLPFLKKTLLIAGDSGKIMLPQALGISHWVLIPLCILAGLLFFYWLEKKGL
jgi:hypothetical protein